MLACFVRQGARERLANIGKIPVIFMRADYRQNEMLYYAILFANEPSQRRRSDGEAAAE